MSRSYAEPRLPTDAPGFDQEDVKPAETAREIEVVDGVEPIPRVKMTRE